MLYTMTEREISCTALLNGDVMAGIGQTLREIAGRARRPVLILDLTRLGAINSIGCAEWSEAIRELLNRFSIEIAGAPVHFIDYCNTMPAVLTPRGAGAGVLVRSFKAPYACGQCSCEAEELLQVDEVSPREELPVRPCPKCGSPMHAEVHAADYLMFLDRNS